MLDSLDRIDRFSRRMDRLLPEEPEPEEPTALGAGQQWSPWSVLPEYRDDPVGFIRLLGYELRWVLPEVAIDWGCRAELPDGRPCTVTEPEVETDEAGNPEPPPPIGYELAVRLDDGTELLVPTATLKRLCDEQERIAKALAVEDRVAVKSGQKTGKTLLAVLLALWWVCTRPRGRVTCTSANFDLVKDPLWVEIWNVYRTCGARGIDWLPKPNLDPKTGWRWPDGRAIRGISVDKPEAAAGKSGDQQLFILDEASGIDAAIAEAFEGNTMGGGKMLALSNPTQTVGFFYEIWKSGQAFWRRFTLRGVDTPNYLTGENRVPGLAQRRPLDLLRRRYGAKSIWYLIRALGEFPSHTPDAVIGVGQVEAALERVRRLVEPEGVLDLGVDVALYGDDDSAICGRRGKVLISPEEIERRTSKRAVVNGYNHLAVTGLVLSVMRALRKPNERVRIKIDAGGGYGSSVATELREQQAAGDLDELIEIYEVNVAWSSSEPDKYPQLRDELWKGCGCDFFEQGGAMHPDPELEQELTAPKYTMTRKGQSKVDDKATIKAVIGRSSNRADAALLAIYEPPEGNRGVSGGKVSTYESSMAGI